MMLRANVWLRLRMTLASHLGNASGFSGLWKEIGRHKGTSRENEVVAGPGIEPGIQFRPFKTHKHIDFTSL